MSVFKAIAIGLGTTVRKPRLLAILYVIHFILSVAVALPFLAIVQRELGHSFLGSNVRPVDLTWLGEAVLKYQDDVPSLLAGLVGAGLLYLALQVFLNGGIVSRLLDREGRTTLAAFFGDCGRYFARFVRLFLVSLIFLFLTFGIVLRLVSALIDPLIEGAVTEWLPLILSNLHLLAALLLLSIVRMVFDYARIAVVADEERRILRALRHAIAFLKKRFFRAWAIYLVIVAVTLAGTVLFYVVLGPLGGPGVLPVLAAFIWMQLYSLFRIWARTLYVSAQAEYYRAHPY